MRNKKDVSQKVLEDYNDVFADINNVLLFGGKELMKETELTNVRTKSYYKVDGKVREQERDVVKYWKKGYMHLAVVGLENQSMQDKDMVFRVIGYDGAVYRNNLNLKPPVRQPVITTILHFGEKPWNTHKSIYEALDIPEEIKPYVSDYRINIIDVPYLSDEQLAMFKSDFKIVADYFVQMRKNKNYVAPKATIQHINELLNMMSVLTGDKRFEDAQNAFEDEYEKKEMRTMCEVLDRIETRGIAKGKAEEKMKTSQKMKLINKLALEGRTGDIIKATSDEGYLQELLDKYYIA